jgi:uncharacterized protein
MSRTAIDPGLFTVGPDGPRLVGSRCGSCGVVTFPSQNGCPRCNNDELEQIELPERGTLWTFPTPGFPPKAAPEGAYVGPLDPFEPYTVGYVELPGHCKVETRLTEPDPSKMRIGMEMKLVLVPITDEHETFAFEPVNP